MDDLIGRDNAYYYYYIAVLSIFKYFMRARGASVRAIFIRR